MDFEKFLRLKAEEKKFRMKQDKECFDLECKINDLQVKLEKKRDKKFKGSKKVSWVDVIDATAQEAANRLGLVFDTSGGIYGIGAKHYFSFYSSDEKDEYGRYLMANLVKAVSCTFNISFEENGDVKNAAFSYDTDEIETHFAPGSLGAINGLGYKQKELPAEVDAFIRELDLKTA